MNVHMGNLGQEDEQTPQESMTIGGTPSNAEPQGFMAIFAGERFENFRHMERFVPTAVIPENKAPLPLPHANRDLTFTGDFLGAPMDLETYLDTSKTSAYLVIKDGDIVYERYRHGDRPETLHLSFSMAKSFISALIGVALHDGHINSIDDPIRDYLSELTSPTFDGVTIKHVLQMSSGVEFDETYVDPNSDINKMSVLVQSMSYVDYINTLKRAHEPGTYNQYASINTQLLGILLVRETGRSLTDYMTKKLWRPLRMEQRGLWMLDNQGYELAMGGLAASARDYARFGLLYLHGGRWGDRQIVPEAWIRQSVTPDAPHLMPGDNPMSSSTSGYQYHWWTPREPDGDFLARGIWGQNIYVHPGNRVVIVKLAADPRNFDATIKLAYIDYMQDLAQSLRD